MNSGVLIANLGAPLSDELLDALRNAGREVATTNSVKRAIEWIFAAPPDLAMIDVSAPGDDGIELGLRLREHSHVPLVFLSDYADRSRVGKACQLGALGYVVKPATATRVVAAVEAAIVLGGELARLSAAEVALASALTTLRTTHEAVGALMERRRLNRHVAYDALRARARAQRRTIAATAEEILVAVERLNLKCPPSRSE